MIRVDVTLSLGAFDLSVAFESGGGIVALFGRSGAGKTTTINLIAGITRPDRGTIEIDGSVLVDTDKGIFIPRHRRRIGLVFQDALLFPHLSVKSNLLFGRWFAPRGARKVDFEPVVETLGIAHLLARRPGKLSGGEKQRVAIGRALLSSPRLLLLDEPLASLDDARKQEIMPLIERLRDEFRIPMVFVSHAVEDVARLATQVVVLEHGRVAAVGAAEEVFGLGWIAAGESRFSRSSFITGTIKKIDDAYGLTEISHPAGSIWLTGHAGVVGREARVVVRATDVALATTRPEGLSVRTVLKGAIERIETNHGPLATVILKLHGDGQLVSLATRMAVDELGLTAGRAVFALIKTVSLDERAVAVGSPRTGVSPDLSEQ